MSHKKNIFMSLLDRITNKADKLEEICETLPLEIESKKVKRVEWNEWHQEWKKAWIHNSSSDLSEEEIQRLREQTSITTKYKAID
jgi:hypothetical protein